MQKGFTLIELIVVISILAVLAAIIGLNIVGETDKARRQAARAQIAIFEQALEMFKADNGFYPTTEQGLESLVQEPAVGRKAPKFKKGGYLKKKFIPKDPWDKEYIYISPGVNNPDFVDIESYGADGEDGGTDENADIENWMEAKK